MSPNGSPAEGQWAGMELPFFTSFTPEKTIATEDLQKAD